MTGPVPITGYTELIGLVASPIRHSHSPRLHTLALTELGIDAVYLAFDVPEGALEAAVAGLRALGARGFNVSMPHKRAIVPLLDRVDPSAALVGACNTVVREGDELVGYNTDGAGWIGALAELGVDLRGREATILGAGGAATAMAVAGARAGAAALHLVNRRDAFFDDALRFADRVTAATGVPVDVTDLDDTAALAAHLERSAVLANATGVGMAPLEGKNPLPATVLPGLRRDLLVTDAVYVPERSEFLRSAEAAGCRTMNGLPMMFHQGAESFRLFTGRAMPLEHVRAHLFA